MDIAVFRRYLQPSPTLRWHPWAPLVAAALLLAFAFYLGMQWGFSAGIRVMTDPGRAMPGSDVFLRHQEMQERPAHAMAREAGKLDAVVHAFVVVESAPPRGWQWEWRDRLESAVFFHGHRVAGPNRDFVVELAQLRLSEYSAANPRWQATSAMCEEMGRYGRSKADFVAGYRPIAAEYSQLLGRIVRPEDLAPDVPGGKCAL